MGFDGPPLSRSVYDRAALRRTDTAWLADAWTRGRVLVVSPAASTPVTRGTGPARLAFRRPADVPADAPRRFLGIADEVPYFAITVEPDAGDPADPNAEPHGGTTWADLRHVGQHADDLEAGLLTSAVALEQWHKHHTHCPRCGEPTVEAQAGWIRTCTNDGSDHFPRTDPAVIMLIHDGDDLALLGRGPAWGEGRFSTLAGFVEPGESLEAAVAREVFEEVGVGVTDIRYVASQPWPFPASLMLGFSGRLAGDPSIHLDPVEMAEAHWFTRDEVRQAAAWVDAGTEPDPAARLRGVSPQLSISRYLLDCWLADRLPS
jgi:NAD+ diphosphatase